MKFPVLHISFLIPHLLLKDIRTKTYLCVIYISGKAEYVCQGKCESSIPDCDGFCKNNGYLQGGRCVPPLYQYCCCLK